jgi:hypothetical protein
MELGNEFMRYMYVVYVRYIGFDDGMVGSVMLKQLGHQILQSTGKIEMIIK